MLEPKTTHFKITLKHPILFILPTEEICFVSQNADENFDFCFKVYLRIELFIRSDLSVGLINKRTNNSRWYTILQRKTKRLLSLEKWGRNLFQILLRKHFNAFITCVGFVPDIPCATLLFKMYFKVSWCQYMERVFYKSFFPLCFSSFPAFLVIFCHTTCPPEHFS